MHFVSPLQVKSSCNYLTLKQAQWHHDIFSRQCRYRQFWGSVMIFRWLFWREGSTLKTSFHRHWCIERQPVTFHSPLTFRSSNVPYKKKLVWIKTHIHIPSNVFLRPSAPITTSNSYSDKGWSTGRNSALQPISKNTKNNIYSFFGNTVEKCFQSLKNRHRDKWSVSTQMALYSASDQCREVLLHSKLCSCCIKQGVKLISWQQEKEALIWIT